MVYANYAHIPSLKYNSQYSFLIVFLLIQMEAQQHSILRAIFILRPIPHVILYNFLFPFIILNVQQATDLEYCSLYISCCTFRLSGVFSFLLCN